MFRGGAKVLAVLGYHDLRPRKNRLGQPMGMVLLIHPRWLWVVPESAEAQPCDHFREALSAAVTHVVG